MRGKSVNAEPAQRCTDASVCRRRIVEVIGQWRSGAHPDADLVLSELPELQEFDSLVIELAYVEFCFRQAAGETISVEAFCSRFPGVAATLRDQIDLHEMILDHPGVLPKDEDIAWPTTGDVVQGFELRSELGQGAFARVHLAEEQAIGNRQVAVKLSRSGAFEANVLGKLQHRNITRIYSAQRDPATGLFVICMPYLGRATLRDVIVMRRTNGPPRRMAAVLESIFTANRGLPEPDLDDDSGGMNPSASYVAGVAWLGAQLADALGEAHRRGILHLDLKPTNVLLTKRGVPKLIDFNLAADLRNDARRLGGTWNYMSPEQVRCTMDGAGSTQIDHRSDIFSLGVVLHELLTGELPDRPERNRVAHSPDSSASAPKSAAAAGRHAHDRRLLRIVQRCLAPDPRDRYQDCEELRRALEHELSLSRRAERWLRRHPRLAAVSCLATVVLGLLVGSYFATRAPYWQRQFESGRRAFEHSQYEAAIGHLNIVIKESPSHAAAYYLRGEAYANLGKYAVATEDLVDGCRLAPDAAKMEFIGYCYNKRRSHTEATCWYDLARQAGRNSVSLYNNQGYSLVQLGQTEAALPWLNRALELDGRCQTALVNRSQAYLNLAMQQRRFPAEAIPDVQLALKLGPPSGQLYHLAAMILARGARYDNIWHDPALACVGHAIEYGASLRTLEKDPALGDLLHAWQKTNPTQAAGGKGPYDATRLIDPRHPAEASSLTVVELRAASPSSGRTLARR